MKVFGLTAGRKNGNSEILLKEAFMALEAHGIETSFIRVQDVDIKSCTGCESCMLNHLKGNLDFRCVHGKDEDHFYFIEQQLREADGIIVSTPVYNLLPPGILIKLLNKLHASGDYRDLVQCRAPKLGAAITIGGTDWVNFAMPVAAMTVMEYIGSYDGIVDTMDVRFNPAVSMVAADDALLHRARELGENLAVALEKGDRKGVYVGPKGICPDCHGNLLEYRDGELWCPMCETKAEYHLDADGKLAVDFTDEHRAKNRWAPWGQQFHNDNIMKGQGKAAQSRELINERKKMYADYKQPLELPEIKK